MRAFLRLVLIIGFAAAGCARPQPAKTYTLHGQILSVDAGRQLITIKHDDIAGLMPGMTMSFPVAQARLLDDRKPGELITATLEVTDAVGRLTAIERVGFDPLPDGSNVAALGGSILNPGDAVPDAAFIDSTNRRRAFAEWRGSVTLVTFIYTQCPLPNFCPLMDRHFARLQQAIDRDRELRGRVKLVTISFDPDHDTPEVLAAHASRLGAAPAVWTFLTGDRGTVDRFGAAMGVGLIREADGSITHNLRTILVGADGRIAHIYSGNEWSPDTVLADLRGAVAAARRP